MVISSVVLPEANCFYLGHCYFKLFYFDDFIDDSQQIQAVLVTLLKNVDN